MVPGKDTKPDRTDVRGHHPGHGAPFPLFPDAVNGGEWTGRTGWAARDAPLHPGVPVPGMMAAPWSVPAGDAETLLELRNVRKTLGGRDVLQGMDLEVRRGEVMAVVGPSGSGKSTMLRCMNRLMEPDSGEVLVDGRDVRGIPTGTLRSRIGMVTQRTVMLPGTVRDNIAWGLRIRGQEPDREKVLECMGAADIGPELMDRDASVLSGGEKQRVALARAIILEPEILLLDEPTAGVDPGRLKAIERTILTIVRERKLTLIWITHDMAQARRVGSRIANIKDGRVVQITTPDLFRWRTAY